MSVAAGDLRAYLRLLAGQIWHDQDDAFHHGLTLQEETLTETLLLKMARDFSPLGLEVLMFNKGQEGENGADWEWFFDGPECSVGFRIQAKVLKRGEGSPGKYAQLGKPAGQTQKLIDDAKKYGLNPIYIFYNHRWVQNHHLFGPSVQPDWFGRSCWGCSVATAEFIKGISDTKGNPDKNLATVIKGSRPWHRFFRLGKTCGTQKATEHMPGGQEFRPRSPTPEWVIMLREFRSANEEVRRETMDRVLTDRDVQGVALITSRQEG
ncbi:DUF6615 family protein [Psychromarinibacter halotolerans]|uniref:DUF6615 family protein n=1 Tax=Psychromarinibacter halotolerans TaxID=1775175 RepID=A0ABV7GQ20_9RHOB|nr:DUF6615 family protein [Psychromarinibacter halotolerans]MDF0594618.1 hypothetical protein [Psychromarinibacter halotolerans]